MHLSPVSRKTNVRLVYASIYNDRAITYRVHHGFDHGEVVSTSIHRMVRSDLAAVGVMGTGSVGL